MIYYTSGDLLESDCKKGEFKDACILRVSQR